MAKRLILSLVVCTAVFALIGCGKAEDDAPVKTNTNAPQTIQPEGSAGSTTGGQAPQAAPTNSPELPPPGR